MAFDLYTSFNQNYVDVFIPFNEIDTQVGTQLGKNKDYSENIKKVLKEDTSFYRLAKAPHFILNFPIYYNYPSAEDYLSLGNKYVYNLCKELDEYRFPSYIEGLGDRTKITTLLGTKYYIVDEKNEKYVPYGYALKENLNNVKTYENKFPLSLGISYNEYLLKEDYDKLTPLEKEDAILKVAVVEKEGDLKGVTLSRKDNLDDIKNSTKTIQYEIKDDDNILQEDTITVTEKNQKIILNVKNIKNSELYVLISGFEFQNTSKHKVTATFKGRSVGRTIENRLTSAYFEPIPNMLLPLGYYENANGEIEIKFSAKGKYRYESIDVITVQMDSYEENIKKLQQNELKEVTYNSKEIRGKVNLEKDAIMQISTSYTIGWKAYIDGEKVDTIKVNTAFIGIPIEKGTHEIVLKYEVPYLKIGICFSIIGVILFIILTIIEKTNKRRKCNNNKT